MKNKTTDICKNFTDAAALVAFIFAAFLLFVAYSGFKPTANAAHFYNVPANAVFIGVAALFALSFLVSVTTRFDPFPALTVSAVLVWYLLACFDQGKLGKDPMVYIILGAVHFAGQLIYAARFIPEHRTERSALTGGIIAAIIAFLTPVAFILEKKVDIFSGGLFWPRVIFIALGIVCALTALYRHPKIGRSNIASPAVISIMVGGGISVIFMILEVFLF